MFEKSVPFKITAADVRPSLAVLASQKPGVYVREDDPSLSGCVNTVNVNGVVKPSCIVGSYLSLRIGVENVPASGDAGGVLTQLIREGRVTIEPEARFLLSMAQVLQDTHEVKWSTIAQAIYGIGATGRRYVEDSK